MKQGGLREPSARERQVLELGARGLTNKQIATQLGISVSTVSATWQRLFLKLGATNRSSAIAKVLQDGATAILPDLTRAVVEMSAARSSVEFTVYRIGRDLRVQFVDGSVEQRFGIAPNTILGKTLVELAPHSTAAREVQDRVEAVFRTKKADRYTCHYEGGGTLRIAEHIMAAELGEDGRVASVFLLAVDLTGVREAQRSHSEIVARLATMVGALSVPVAALGVDGRWRTMNEAFASLGTSAWGSRPNPGEPAEPEFVGALHAAVAQHDEQGFGAVQLGCQALHVLRVVANGRLAEFVLVGRT